MRTRAGVVTVTPEVRRALGAGLVLAGALLAPAGGAAAQATDPPAAEGGAAATAAAAVPARAAPAPPVKEVAAAKVARDAIEVDGRLDDAAWSTAVFHADFQQKGRNRGFPAQVRTEVAFLYDDEALYVAARMENEPGHPPVRLLGRRDEVGSAERLLVSLDTYRDRTTAYTFGVTAGGVRVDHVHARDSEGWRDESFDPVWEASVASGETAWTAELRIPFSQLRFSPGEAQSWGLNVRRWNPASHLNLYWVVVPYDLSGWASRFGELHGLEGISGGSRAEITPYVLGRAVLLDPALGGGGEPVTRARVGGDLKLGVGPNLTLDATVNPDFGQVEVDPARVNLTAFETFFPEQRPFFLEGREIFRAHGPSWFYSRRVGSVPRVGGGGRLFEQVENATILGGARLTGRLPSGLSIGTLAAVTDEARVPLPGEEGATVEVAPRTGFALARLQQEVGSAGSSIGLIATGVQRALAGSGPLEARLPGRALGGGADWGVRFGGGEYEMTGFAGMSHVSGSPQSMTLLQRSSIHYFQRPDAAHVDVDSAATSLTGWTAGARLGKIGGAHWLWSVEAAATSPDFEIRDAGSQGRADRLDVRSTASFGERNAQGELSGYRVGVALASAWNFAGDRQLLAPSTFVAATWNNLWSTSAEIGVSVPSLSDDLTRGGPLMRAPGSLWADLHLTSATSNRLWWSAGSDLFLDDAGGWSASLNGGLTVTAGRWVELSLFGGASAGEHSRYFVGALPDGGEATFGRRYVFAHLDRRELFTQLRGKLAFAPDAVLTLYAEPFLSTGEASDFGELTEAGAGTVRSYGTSGGVVERLDDGAWQVTDGDSIFRIENHDFWVRSFRATGVLRWEWRRGSTLFLIWQRSGWSLADRVGETGFDPLLGSFEDPGQDIFVAKLSVLVGGE